MEPELKTKLEKELGYPKPKRSGDGGRETESH